MPKPCVCIQGQMVPNRCKRCPYWSRPLAPMTIQRVPNQPHLALVTVAGRTHCELWDEAKTVLDYIERHGAGESKQ